MGPAGSDAGGQWRRGAMMPAGSDAGGLREGCRRAGRRARAGGGQSATGNQ